MLNKQVIVCMLIFSYLGAVLHSMVPHHHHDTLEEAEKHHHVHHASNHGHSHSHDHDAKSDNGGSNGSRFFLSHSINADVLLTDTSIENTANGTKSKISVAHCKTPLRLGLPHAISVFRPPSNETTHHTTHYPFRALRAPPLSIA
jgi:hypothetical protein